MYKKSIMFSIFFVLASLCSSSWAYNYEIRNIKSSLLEFVPETYLAPSVTVGAKMIDDYFIPSVFVSSNGFRVNYSVPVGFDGLAPPNKGEICAVDSSRPGLDKRTYFADAGIELSDSVCDTFETKDLEAYAGFVTVSSFDLRSDFITRILDRNGTELKRMIGRVPLVIEGREAVDGNGTRFVFNFRNNTSKAIKLLKVTPLEGDESYIRVISGGDAEVLLRPDPTVVHNATVELIGRKSSPDSTGSFEVKVEVKYEIEGKSLTGMVILACDNHRAVMQENVETKQELLHLRGEYKVTADRSALLSPARKQVSELRDSQSTLEARFAELQSRNRELDEARLALQREREELVRTNGLASQEAMRANSAVERMEKEKEEVERSLHALREEHAKVERELLQLREDYKGAADRSALLSPTRKQVSELRDSQSALEARFAELQSRNGELEKQVGSYMEQNARLQGAIATERAKSRRGK